MPKPMLCSFCGKSQHDVKQLIAGPNVFICDECVETCIEVLGAEREWCDVEIANLKRLRKQARPRKTIEQQSEPKRVAEDGNWISRLFR